MPHLILDGEFDLPAFAERVRPGVHRWGTAVLKIENLWRRSDDKALLVEGVVVEHSRAVHPVALVATARGTTSVRLWQGAPVERTPAVQRWLAIIAGEIQNLGGGSLLTSNIGAEVLAGLEITAKSEEEQGCGASSERKEQAPPSADHRDLQQKSRE